MPDAAPILKRRAPGRRLGTSASKRVAGTTRQNARRRVFARDAYTCQHCRRVAIPENLELDHIRPLADGGSNADANLQTLCNRCHGEKTRKEATRYNKKL